MGQGSYAVNGLIHQGVGPGAVLDADNHVYTLITPAHITRVRRQRLEVYLTMPAQQML